MKGKGARTIDSPQRKCVSLKTETGISHLQGVSRSYTYL